MSEVSHLNINGTTYDIKDEKARKLKTYTLVAAKDSSADMKAIADYVCTGSNDETTINQAIAATEDGGEVVLANGHYRPSQTNTSHIIIDKKITFRGMSSPCNWDILTGTGAEIFCEYGTAIEVKSNRSSDYVGCILRDFGIEGNTDYGFESGAAGIFINNTNIATVAAVTIENVKIFKKYCGINIEGGRHRITKCDIRDGKTCINIGASAHNCLITENRLLTVDYNDTPIVIDKNNNYENGLNIIENNITNDNHKSIITVAAYNSSYTDRVNVDFVCDGKTDHTVISNAIAALPTSGGKIVLMPGTYLIGNSINTNVSKSVLIQGCGDGTQLLGAANAASFFSARKTSRAQGMELRVSDLTICNNTSKIRGLVEDVGGYKSAEFENVTFRSNYTIPSNLGYAPATYTYVGDFGSVMFNVQGTNTDFEDALTFVNCRLITDYPFNYVLQDVVMKNFCVIGSKNGVTQTFAVYDSDVDIRAPRGGLIIKANGNSRVAKTNGVTVTSSGTNNTIY